MRLRMRLSSHHADKEAGKRLADADSALHRAMDAYRSVLKNGSPKEKKKAAQAIDGIRRTLRALGTIRPLDSRYDTSDPDLIPESEKRVRPRQSKKAERAE